MTRLLMRIKVDSTRGSRWICRWHVDDEETVLATRCSPWRCGWQRGGWPGWHVFCAQHAMGNGRPDRTGGACMRGCVCVHIRGFFRCVSPRGTRRTNVAKPPARGNSPAFKRNNHGRVAASGRRCCPSLFSRPRRRVPYVTRKNKRRDGNVRDENSRKEAAQCASWYTWEKTAMWFSRITVDL